MTDQYFFAVANAHRTPPNSPEPKDENATKKIDQHVILETLMSPSGTKTTTEEESTHSPHVEKAETANDSPTMVGTLRRRLTKTLQTPPDYEEEEAGFWLDD